MPNDFDVSSARQSEAYAADESAIKNERDHGTSVDFSSANSMQDMGRKLLQSVGFASPDDVSIAAAIEANDAFVERLEAIRDAAQGLTIEQDE